jgi:SAM-dependent methyltransferase
MDEQTARRLNAINRTFYTVVADDFDSTRSGAWGGWMTLLPTLRPLAVRQQVRILDAGCGNGRFGAFLAAHLFQGRSIPLIYHGVDNNPLLLAKAAALRHAFPNLTARFEQRDLLDLPAFEDSYDLIALMAVLHHIPGRERRARLVAHLAERLSVGGLMVFTSWRFYEYARFRRRIAAWDADLTDKVEPGDFLLDWRRGQHAGLPALRYCHHIDDAEQDALIAATGLQVVLSFRADGEGDRANAYVALRRNP